MERIPIIQMLGIFPFIVGHETADQIHDIQRDVMYQQKWEKFRPYTSHQRGSEEPQETAYIYPSYRDVLVDPTVRPLLSTVSMQAYPHPSATQTPYADNKPKWHISKPINNDRFNTMLDAEAAPAIPKTNDTKATAARAPVLPNSHNNFNADLFQAITSAMPQRNIVYSPISLQLLLAFVYIGASGQTALQLQRALSLPVTRLETENLFANLLKTNVENAHTHLVMANKMYHNRKLTVQPDIERSARYFNSEVEAIDFDRRRHATATINDWIAKKTQNIIRELLTPEQLDAQTQAILLSAIHFKAKWEKEFSVSDTEQTKFYVSSQRAVNVSMMYNDDMYRYGEFPELDATGLEIPYENANISMLLLLPNKGNGLPAMEERLQGVDLGSLTARMNMESVELRLPRFNIDFELDMRESLGKLGITDLFTDHAELRGFFRSQSAAVSQMKHKAFIDVNETGSEAAAASFIQLIPLSLPSRVVEFTVNHPFVFAIRSPQAVYFIGHVVNIQS
ncbi:serine protease inhibitor 42Dd-like isoform X2 [Eurosta solidaginis]|uniref:serine protease inhibitor 42Dd-like isoform X2 n=1 Tax=Eurosta solidaginis TaxID=178769 RepID=UPI003530A5E8